MKKYLFIKKTNPFNKGEVGGFLDEKGMVLSIALVIMTILALVGASALLTTNTEVKIAANDRIYRSGFYSADAGILASSKASRLAVWRGNSLFSPPPAIPCQYDPSVRLKIAYSKS